MGREQQLWMNIEDGLAVDEIVEEHARQSWLVDIVKESLRLVGGVDRKRSCTESQGET